VPKLACCAIEFGGDTSHDALGHAKTLLIRLLWMLGS
jgi:hypothetical protein